MKILTKKQINLLHGGDTIVSVEKEIYVDADLSIAAEFVNSTYAHEQLGIGIL